MSTEDRNDQTLKRLLRELPPQRAPATLESRVLAALRPDYTRAAGGGYRHWPLPVRSACLVVCTAIAALTIYAEASLPSPAFWVPPAWWYGGLAAAGSLYAVFLGLAALGYHALYRPPLNKVQP
jgi:hypothetical protein